MAAVIALTQGEVALVDFEDLDRVNQFEWSLKRSRNGGLYAQANFRHADGWRPETLHRFVIGAGRGELIDHRNGDGLDCRKTNLRQATHRQNMQNQQKRAAASSRFKGVTRHKASGKWMAYIGTGSERKYLGLHESERGAAEAYDRAAHKHFGDFARPNFKKAN